jgi:hypothetical protein
MAWTVAACIGGVACSEKKEALLTFDEMKVTIWNLSCAEQYATYFRQGDSTLNNNQRMIVLFNEAFRQQRVSKDRFYKTLAYYNEHPREQKVLFDSVIAYGTRLQDSLNKPQPSPEAPAKLKREINQQAKPLQLK